MRKRLLSMIMATAMTLCCVGNVAADVPKGTVVIDGKGYTLKYVNEHSKELDITGDVDSVIKLYDGRWVDVKSEKIVPTKEIPRVKYVDDDGSVWVYEEKDGKLIEELSDRAILKIRAEKVKFGIGYKISGAFTSPADDVGGYGRFMRILNNEGEALTPKIEITEFENETYAYFPMGTEKVNIEISGYNGELVCMFKGVELKLEEDSQSNIIVYEKQIDKNLVIEVSNIEEFIKAIGSNRKIILKKGVYDLLETELYGQFVSVSSNDYGSGFLISSVKNLIIEGEEVLYKGDEMIHPVELVIQPRYMSVMSFRNCENVTLRNLNIGHTPDKGVCSGGVIRIDKSSNFNIENSNLYGCGTEGIGMNDSTGLTVKNSVIEECSSGLAYFSQSNDIKFINSKFRKTYGYYGFEMVNAYDVIFEGCSFSDNGKISNEALFKIENVKKKDGTKNLTLKGCTFENNKMKALVNKNFKNDIILEDNEFKENKFD